MFKIRNKNSGLYYYNRKWTDRGRTYKNIGAAKKDFRKIMQAENINRSELEIVEFVLIERAVV